MDRMIKINSLMITLYLIVIIEFFQLLKLDFQFLNKYSIQILEWKKEFWKEGREILGLISNGQAINGFAGEQTFILSTISRNPRLTFSVQLYFGLYVTLL